MTRDPSARIRPRTRQLLRELADRLNRPPAPFVDIPELSGTLHRSITAEIDAAAAATFVRTTSVSLDEAAANLQRAHTPTERTPMTITVNIDRRNDPLQYVLSIDHAGTTREIALQPEWTSPVRDILVTYFGPPAGYEPAARELVAQLKAERDEWRALALDGIRADRDRLDGIVLAVRAKVVEPPAAGVTSVVEDQPRMSHEWEGDPKIAELLNRVARYRDAAWTAWEIMANAQDWRLDGKEAREWSEAAANWRDAWVEDLADDSPVPVDEIPLGGDWSMTSEAPVWTGDGWVVPAGTPVTVDEETGQTVADLTGDADEDESRPWVDPVTGLESGPTDA